MGSSFVACSPPFGLGPLKPRLVVRRRSPLLSPLCSSCMGGTSQNDKLLQILPEDVALNEALECADDILRQGVPLLNATDSSSNQLTCTHLSHGLFPPAARIYKFIHSFVLFLLLFSLFLSFFLSFSVLPSFPPFFLSKFLFFFLPLWLTLLTSHVFGSLAIKRQPRYSVSFSFHWSNAPARATASPSILTLGKFLPILRRAFRHAGVVGISDIIVQPGMINVDFSDVRTIMSDAGTGTRRPPLSFDRHAFLLQAP